MIGKHMIGTGSKTSLTSGKTYVSEIKCQITGLLNKSQLQGRRCTRQNTRRRVDQRANYVTVVDFWTLSPSKKLNSSSVTNLRHSLGAHRRHGTNGMPAPSLPKESHSHSNLRVGHPPTSQPHNSCIHLHTFSRHITLCARSYQK